MVMRPNISPTMLRWAADRVGIAEDDLVRRFSAFPTWERGESRPTLKQLETFAKAMHVPIGYLFLREPPVESVPLPDFRTVAGRKSRRPSPDLLETVYLCQQRQDWYREFARSAGEEALPFVGAAKTSDPPDRVAANIRAEIGFDVEARSVSRTWDAALSSFVSQTEAAGILVMTNGVVLNNTHRKLDPQEFRGFAMADALAPLVFVNGADTRSGQMFTLAHELAHIWLGQSALDDADPSVLPGEKAESWCNRVAAELLVPMEILRNEIRGSESLDTRVRRLAHRFKVSTLVVLRRIHDAGALPKVAFRKAYAQEIARLEGIQRGSGGNFFKTLPVRVSKRFLRAVVLSTVEGQTLYRDAFRMLGISKFETFNQISQPFGVAS